ncbi:MAG TPA: hypothetical protein VFQ53_01655 [Kofleriaceae bacterium]|nr:hypothetical protein [Kofleriaceae bacterium]
MRRLLASLALAACGPATTVHPDTVAAGCPREPVRLSGQEDVAGIAGCAKLGAVTIRTGAPLSLGALRRLQTIDGDLVIGPSVGLEDVALPEVVTITGTLRVIGNGNVHGVFLPKLARVAAIEVDSNPALANLSLPSLAVVPGPVAILNNPELELVELSALTAVEGELAVIKNPKLVMLEVAKLERAKTLRVEDNPALPAATNDALNRLRAPRASP